MQDSEKKAVVKRFDKIKRVVGNEICRLQQASWLPETTPKQKNLQRVLILSERAVRYIQVYPTNSSDPYYLGYKDGPQGVMPGELNTNALTRGNFSCVQRMMAIRFQTWVTRHEEKIKNAADDLHVNVKLAHWQTECSLQELLDHKRLSPKQLLPAIVKKHKQPERQPPQPMPCSYYLSHKCDPASHGMLNKRLCKLSPS
jgi:hypothetical protein